MKKNIILIASLFIAVAGYSQTKNYIKVETTKFKKDDIYSKLVKYDKGTIDIDSKFITIDKSSARPKAYNIVTIGSSEPEDEGFYSIEYLCVSQQKNGYGKLVKIIAMYTPNKELCDVIVKNGHSNIDYCLNDK